MDQDADKAILIKAANFAAEKHKKQKRKDPAGTPYINHPIGKYKVGKNFILFF